MAILGIIFGAYFILLIALMLGWEQTLALQIPDDTVLQPITIIVPIRNEEAQVEKVIQSLLLQNYPKDKIQILIINDHSTDRSVELVGSDSFGFIQLYSLGDRQSGKKAAITLGMEKSLTEIIVTTDADCLHHTDWLRSINALFGRSQTQLVVGAVAIQKAETFFDKLQAIEFSSLISSGASMLYWGIPAMANGANLAFRKSAFNQVRGYEDNAHIASGDDEFILKKIFNAYPLGVVFNNRPEGIVQTSPQPSLIAFLRQRFRWAGKWKHQSNQKVKWIAMAVFLFQVFFIVTLSLVVWENNRMAIILLLAKAGLEGVFLWRACQFLNVGFTLVPFVVLQFFYPFYVSYTALVARFIKPSWKGRINLG